ncbi:MAG: ATPase, T2SS/T4P/T4SS family [Armatimonadota bacterium]|nr:ATPase, T2SS/T4P/T4SS family [Armatimonadota bacterium]
MKLKPKKLGEILLARGAVTEEDLEKALAEQGQTKAFLGQILLRRGVIKKRDLAEALEDQLGVPSVELSDLDIPSEMATYLPENIVRSYRVVPFSVDNNVMSVAMADPLNLTAIESMRLVTGMEVRTFFAAEEDVVLTTNQLFDGRVAAYKAIEDTSSMASEEDGVVTVRELERMVEDAPVVRLVDSIIQGAITGNASDIHVEPREHAMRVRYRVDGILYDMMQIPKRLQPAVTSRIKIMAGVNIAERRLPQDGRISVKNNGGEYDLRVSTLLTVFGEKVVMRILDKASVLLQLEDLGFLPDQERLVESLIEKPYGMILSTGPTGSGKTTALYTALNRINSEDRNIVTVEDPVEYQLVGINQSQVHTGAGITFARGLRAILRQDPDIIMVGEIRDLETAEIAIQAALTGHLVFSSLHTNDAASALPRLIDMGVEPFLIASSVIAAIGQRLVRVVCRNCKTTYKPDTKVLDELGVPPEKRKNLVFSRGQGCSTCSNRGYRGRTGVFEILRMNEKIKRLVMEGKSALEIRDAAVADNMVLMQDCGRAKVLDGITTPEEVMRVVYVEED